MVLSLRLISVGFCVGAETDDAADKYQRMAEEQDAWEKQAYKTVNLVSFMEREAVEANFIHVRLSKKAPF